MEDLIERALKANRESKRIEFKSGFNPDSPGEWCEIIKDIVAIANSGGGIIVFGLNSRGKPTGVCVNGILDSDPADITNKISKYTGTADLEFDVRELNKDAHRLCGILIQATSTPLLFEKPGTYACGAGQQKTAFGMGTIYFRHGAKSEPGVCNDIRLAIQRQIDLVRKSWMKGFRKVAEAPPGSQFIVKPNLGFNSNISSTVRAVNDPKATPVLLTRDPAKAKGIFVHEEVSEGIFDEVNNVVDANRILAKGQPKFLLGTPVYYRIYAERHHVSQDDERIAHLFHSAAIELNAPHLFWTLALSEASIAATAVQFYLRPRSPYAYLGIRLGALLGLDFCNWVDEKWTQKWYRHPQPPGFYWSLHRMKSELATANPLLIAARLSANSKIEIPGEPLIRSTELLGQPKSSASLLSKTCLSIFGGNKDLRPVARSLDLIAYGYEIQKRAIQIAAAIISSVGSQEVIEPESDTDGGAKSLLPLHSAELCAFRNKWSGGIVSGKRCEEPLLFRRNFHGEPAQLPFIGCGCGKYGPGQAALGSRNFQAVTPRAD